MPVSPTQLQRMTDTIEARFLDVVTVIRPGVVVDIEGDTGGPPTTVLAPIDDAPNGTIGNARARDRETAATLGQQLDAILMTTTAADIHLGDTVAARGEEWTAISVDRQRFVLRVGLRRIE